MPGQPGLGVGRGQMEVAGCGQALSLTGRAGKGTEGCQAEKPKPGQSLPPPAPRPICVWGVQGEGPCAGVCTGALFRPAGRGGAGALTRKSL